MDEIVKLALDEVDDLAQADDYERALRRVDELAAQYPMEPWILRSRAYVNSRQGQSENAIADLSKAISICETEPDFFYTRGILLFEVGRYREAVTDFTKVIELCDYHKSDYYREGAYFFRADAYVRLNELHKAKADCQHVKDGMSAWTDRIRTKADLLAACEKHG